MNVFLTGSTGWIGSAIARELISAGHSVLGLVRRKEGAEALAAAGGTPLIGSLRDLDVLRQGLEIADGVIHTAFGLDISKVEELADEDRQAILTFGEVFAGSNRPIVVTSGVFLTPPGQVFAESARPPVEPTFPRASEQTAFSLADRGLNACVVRNPRSVHGIGETHGFMPMLAALARDKRVSGYVEDGKNLWPAVHRTDAARAFCLALERGTQGAAYHAIAEQGVEFRLIAEAIGRQIGVPSRSFGLEEAKEHFGALALWAGGNGPASNQFTRESLGWEPREVGLVADIDQEAYFAKRS